MQGRVFAFFALLGAVFAGQSYNVYPLVNDVLYTGALAIQPSSADGFDVDIFSFYVPENASSVNVTFTNLDSDACIFVSLYIKQGGLPCDSDEYDESQYRCGLGTNLGEGVDDAITQVYVAGNNDGLFEYEVNAMWYFGVSRYYSSDYDTACGYSLLVNINSSCATGSIGLPASLSSYDYSQCSAPYTTVSTYPSSFNVSSDENNYPVYKVSIPVQTGNFKLTLNSTSDYNTVLGRSYGAPSTDEYNCYQDDASTDGAYFIYDVICYTPRSGDFWIVLYNDYEPYNATITFAGPTVCPIGTGGWNCSFVSIPYANATSPFTIPYSATAEYLSVAFYYVYMDIPANFSSNSVSVTASSTGDGDNEIWYRRNGFVEEDYTYGVESDFEYYEMPHTFTLNQFDWAIAGRIYFAFSCSSAPSCVITVDVNGTLTTTSGSSSSVSSTTSTTGTTKTTTTGTTTTGSTTTASTTTTTTGATSTGTSTSGAESSPASVVIPSVVFAAVAAFAALF